MGLKVKIALFASIAFSIGAYFSIQHVINPIHVYELIGAYLLAFAAYATFLNQKVKLNLWHVFVLGLAFRLFMFSWPTLSDDFYRFYWDGKLLAEGTNPYATIPKSIFGLEVNNIKVAHKTLYDFLNSKDYFSVYPPFLQYIFGFSALVGNSLNGFVAVFSILVLSAEVGTFFLVRKILLIKNLPLKNIAIYWLNPLIVIELNGNLHGEVFMILAIAAALYFYNTKKFLITGLALGLAVLTKLYPILFIPFFLLPFNKKPALVILLGVVISVFALGRPLINLELAANIFESIQLYYAKFEFNGSIYNLLKQIGIKLTGYNQINLIGKVLGLLTLVGFGVLYFFKVKSPSKFTIERNIYLGMILFYLLSTTIMPWYLSIIIFASVFNKSKVGIVWSALVILTYSAFSNTHFKEDSALVAVEYYALAAVIIFELRNYFRQKIFESN
ncbi:MAG: DUF2029 domain-containing protein [Bacteroidia bacterium]